MARQAAVVVLLVIALRLPFLNQAIQGDDFYYLKGAEHAQIDPLHPNHARFIVQGEMVDMRGHPHPPLNSWFLGALLAVTHDEREPVYHVAYLLWSIAAALGMLALARRFVPERALAATLLFVVTLPFMVNGTSLEADLPLLGCWMVGDCAIRDGDRPPLAPIRGRSVHRRRSRGPRRVPGGRAHADPGRLHLGPPTRMDRRLGGFARAARCGRGLSAVRARFERSRPRGRSRRIHADAMVYRNRRTKRTVPRRSLGHTGWILFPALSLAAFRRITRLAWIVPIGAGLAAAFVDAEPAVLEFVPP